MKEPDYKGYWAALPHMTLLPDRQEAFRREFREEIIGNLFMLHRIGLAWGATSLHLNPPEDCDLCGIKMEDCQMFVDGETEDGRWGNMCFRCFHEEGHSLGWGKGQLYLNLGDGAWRLVAGGDPKDREPMGD